MIEPKDIEELFQNQLEKIKDQELRDRVVKTWVESCKKGNWKTAEKQLCRYPMDLGYFNRTRSGITGKIFFTAKLDGLVKCTQGA